MTKKEREMMETLRKGLLICANGAEATEEKEIIEEALPEGRKRKRETIVKRSAPDMEAIKMIYTMLHGEEKKGKDEAISVVHLVPRPESVQEDA